MSQYAWEHFKTITKHKIMVMGYCFRIGLYKQGILHDLSKYSPAEFMVGCRYYQGTRSPNNAEREATGMSLSWLHHKGRNKHHFEYWVDYTSPRSDTVIAGVQMPRKYVAEMIMDRICASRVYNGFYSDSQPLEYFMKSKDSMWFIHRETRRQMEFLLTMLAEKGERKTLSYIKHVYLKEQNRMKSTGK